MLLTACLKSATASGALWTHTRGQVVLKASMLNEYNECVPLQMKRLPRQNHN